MRKISIIICFTVFASMLSSCLSEEEKKAREEQKITLRLKEKEQEEQRLKVLARKDAVKDSLRAIQLENERREKAIYEKFIDNQLENGATPYAYLFGYNKSCKEWGCSEIKVRTPSSSDVLVTIKKNDKVVKHAYIRASNSYTFEMPNGTYQPFFYYGKGWDPDKVMKQTENGLLKGGFISDELFSKDNPQTLNNNSLEYELILQQSGNFSTKPSSKEEAF